jgi:hypothetical protein
MKRNLYPGYCKICGKRGSMRKMKYVNLLGRWELICESCTCKPQKEAVVTKRLRPIRL